MDNPRSVQLDSLRALGAIGVLVYHVAAASSTNWLPLAGGFTSHLNVGVTIFFLLSGFLLYRPFARSALAAAEFPSLSRYFKRRILRIVPAYWVALTLLATWPGLKGVFTSQWWVYYGFAQSYRQSWIFGGIAPAWSLSVEVAFYVLMPVVAFAVARMSRGRSFRARARVQFGVLTVLGVGGVALHFWIYRAQMVNLQTSLLTHLLWFAIGMSLAVAQVWADQSPAPSRWRQAVIAHPTACWLLALTIYTGIALTPFFPRPWDGREYSPAVYTTQHVLYAAVAALMMLPAVFGERTGGVPQRLLSHRMIAWVGVVSYGVFLWHSPLLLAITERGGAEIFKGFPFFSLFLPTLGASIVCGWVSYRMIEQPSMRLARRRNEESRVSVAPAVRGDG